MSGDETRPSVDSGASEQPPRERIIRRGSNRTGLYTVVVIVILVALIVVVGVQLKWFGGAKNNRPGACPTGITLQGAGANFVAPLVSHWGPEYATATGNQVNYQSTGSGSGITSLSTKGVDFAMTDDPLNASQTTSMPGRVLTFPSSAGAIAIVYNLPGTSQPLQLSGAVIAQIYLGHIATWNDPALVSNNTGVTLPNQPIGTVHRQESAGTTYVLSDFLSRASPSWAASVGKSLSTSNFPHVPGAIAQHGDSGLAKYVDSNPYTIGYAAYSDLPSGAEYAKVLNPSGAYILPSVASANSAIANQANHTTFPAATGDWSAVSMVDSTGSADYPLATLAYLFVIQSVDSGYAPDLPKAQVLVQWLNWALTTGQADAPALLYVPLPASIVQMDRTAVSTMTFNGAAIPACA